jgi:hypothetical protein
MGAAAIHTMNVDLHQANRGRSAVEMNHRQEGEGSATSDDWRWHRVRSIVSAMSGTAAMMLLAFILLMRDYAAPPNLTPVQRAQLIIGTLAAANAGVWLSLCFTFSFLAASVLYAVYFAMKASDNNRIQITAFAIGATIATTFSTYFWICARDGGKSLLIEWLLTQH